MLPLPNRSHALRIIAAIWLAALSALVLLAPVSIPGDGLVWYSGSKGLVIHKIAQAREVTFAPGQRVVYFNGTPWESTRELHQPTPFYPLVSPRISYEIREGQWKLRRQVLQSTLPFSTSLTTYWPPAALLLFLAVVSLARRLHALDAAGLGMVGSATAVWVVGHQNLTLFTMFQLRQLELTAILMATGLAILLRRFIGVKNRFVDFLPAMMATLIALSWVVMTDRWQWWSYVQWGTAILAGLTFAAGLYRSFSAKRLSGS